MSKKFTVVYLTCLVFISCLLLTCRCTSDDDEDDDESHEHQSDQSRYSGAKFPEEATAAYWNKVAQNVLHRKLFLKPNTNIARNIILFLGDGLSITTLAAARVYIGGEERQLSFEKFPFVGLSKTYCVDKQVPDSACTATAYLCGVKANYETIGVTAGLTPGNCSQQSDPAYQLDSILSWAQEAGKATGIVTTARVTHASPAAAYAHAARRTWENDAKVSKSEEDPKTCEDIATQLVNRSPGKDINVIMGGGRSNFLPKDVKDPEGDKGSRKDGQNLIDAWSSDKKLRGLKSAYVWNRDQLLKMNYSETDYVLGLFESSHMQYNLDTVADGLQHNEPTLSEMVRMSLHILEKRDKGYFLFVEGGRIDHAHHGTKAKKALDETIEFGKAVEMALGMTEEGETLIVVTSDHAHTMSFSGYADRGNDILGYARISKDRPPISILSYANGPGHTEHTARKAGVKANRGSDRHHRDYRFPAMVDNKRESHGGQDVAVFAHGPWAHLFTGNYEQNVIPHAMAYAACIGKGRTLCDDKLYG